MGGKVHLYTRVCSAVHATSDFGYAARSIARAQQMHKWRWQLQARPAEPGRFPVAYRANAAFLGYWQ